MAATPVPDVSIMPDTTVPEARAFLRRLGAARLTVAKRGRVLGYVTDQRLANCRGPVSEANLLVCQIMDIAKPAA